MMNGANGANGASGIDVQVSENGSEEPPESDLETKSSPGGRAA
jgi:hypothetical protein